MKHTHRLLLFPLTLLISSCEQKDYSGSPAAPPPPPEEAGFRACLGAPPKADDFTDWMSKAELQYAQESQPPGRYFAFVEGRSTGGFRQYRAARATFPTDQWEQWAVFWGLSEQEMFEAEIKLLRNGFSRQQLQVFTDAGTAVHQGVWLRPLGLGAIAGAVAAAPTPTPEPQPVLEPQTPSPAAVVEPSVPVAVPVPVPVPEPSTRQITHVVTKNETLSSVAKRYHVLPADIKSDNRLKADMLRIGQRLTINIKDQRAAKPAAAP
jgi:LysM repeat protein